MGVPVKWVSVEWDSTVYYIYFISLWGSRGGDNDLGIID